MDKENSTHSLAHTKWNRKYHIVFAMVFSITHRCVNFIRAIASARYKTTASVNKELIILYYNIGKIINNHKTWGNKFIESLSTDIALEFPNSKGYSVRNLKYMAKFAELYPDEEFVQQPVAQIPWGHNIVLMDKFDDENIKEWYIKKSIKMAGQEMFSFIKLKVDCMSVKN